MTYLNIFMTYLNIFVLVSEVLGDELDSLGGLVGLGRQEDVADVAVSPLSQRRVLLKGLAGVQLAGRGVEVTQLHHLRVTKYIPYILLDIWSTNSEKYALIGYRLP